MVGLGKGGGCCDAPSAYPQVDGLAGQRWQEVRKPGPPHPIRQEHRIAAPNQQGIGLLDRWDPTFALDAGHHGKLQHSQRLPTQSSERTLSPSTDRLPCAVGTAWERVYGGGNDESVGLLNRLA